MPTPNRALIRRVLLTALLTLTLAGTAAAQDPMFILSWGSTGGGPGQFQAPYGIAVDGSGDVYVCDQYNCRIQKFGGDGTFLTMWGSVGTGPGQFNTPLSIGVDAADHVIMADASSRIHVFTADGTFIRSWLPSDPSLTISDIAVDPAGTIYIANELMRRVEVYTLDGILLRTIGTGSLTAAGSVAVDPSGNIYVGVDYGPAFEIVKFDASGHVITRWGQTGSGNGQFNSPVGLAVTNEFVFVADHSNNRVQYFTSQGQFLGTWGTAGSGPGQFLEPTRLAFSPHGDIYVSDVVNNRIQEFGDLPTPALRSSWGELMVKYR